MRIINVKDFEGLYAVSDDGRVFSLKSGNELTQSEREDGYLRVGLCKNGKEYTKSVHVVVFNSFNNYGFMKRRTDDLVIDHIDGDKHNNRLENLRRIRTRENTARCPYYNENDLPRGVHLRKNGRYVAGFMVKQEQFYLGSFGTAEEAGKAYADAVKAYEEHGIVPVKRDRTIKTCKICGKTKPKSEFYHVRGHGSSWMCKECAKEYARQQRALKRENKNSLNFIDNLNSKNDERDTKD